MAAEVQKIVCQLKFQAEHADQAVIFIAEIKILSYIALREIFSRVPVLHSGQPSVLIPVSGNADARAAGMRIVQTRTSRSGSIERMAAPFFV